MKFHLSSEQEQIRDAVLRYALERGAAGVRRGVLESEHGFNEEFWFGLMELGVGGLMIPEAHGGMGLELIDLAIVAEALGYAAAPGPFLGHALAALAIACGGSDAQKAVWLPKLASGEAIGTVALAEADDVWRPDAWRLHFEGGKLTGAKANVLYPNVSEIIVVGTVDGQLALVENNAAGLSIENLDVADRTRRIWNMRFDGAAAEILPGREAARRVFEAGLVLLAADACGGANYLVELSAEYARTRHQFGGPIGRFQGLKFQLANMAVRVEPLRSLYWYAAHAFDHIPNERARIASVTKAHAAECFMQTARDAVEAHGGIGYTWEYDAQLWFKRAMFDYAYLGTPAVHRSYAAELADW